jgi:hypothetical protein
MIYLGNIRQYKYVISVSQTKSGEMNRFLKKILRFLLKNEKTRFERETVLTYSGGNGYLLRWKFFPLSDFPNHSRLTGFEI